MPDTARAGDTKRTKRSPETVRSLLLDSALALFAQRGYANTSTREVAARAGVSEALLFRHFGTKVSLFEHAVVKPFARFLDDYADRWAQSPAASSGLEELTSDYVGGLYDLLREHRELVVALVAAQAHEDHLKDVVTEALKGPIERIEEITAQEALARSYDSMDPRLATRAFMAMVMGMAVLDEVFDRKDRPRSSRDDVVGEMTALLVYGLEGQSKRRDQRAGATPLRPSRARRRKE